MFIAPFGISRAWLLPKHWAERRGREELDAHPVGATQMILNP